MTDTKTTLTWVLKDEVSGPARGIGGALGGLVNPATLAIGAVAGLVGGLAVAAKAAAEEQVNIEKLNASLAANVEGFNGNTDAIEELISQRELLGFSDDEQRDSLARLLVTTHDVTEAQNLQALAMDLARLKGVDLATATDALLKLNQGSTRELKALGIEVDANATATENLAAVQAAATGQAETYSETLQGKWDALQIKFGDVIEDIGAALIGPLTDLADWFLNDLPVAVAAGSAAIAQFWDKDLRGLRDMLGEVNSALLTFNLLVNPKGLIPNAPGGGGGGPYKPPPATNILGMDTMAPPPPPRSTQSLLKGGRAAGGDVDPWGVYTVGEQGPETLVMGGSGGSIIPGGGGGGVPVVIPVIIDGREVARIVDEHLYYMSRSAAPSRLRS